MTKLSNYGGQDVTFDHLNFRDVGQTVNGQLSQT